VEFGTFLLMQSPSADPPGSRCSFWFGDPTQDQVLRSMRLFAQEVMPAFRGARP